MTRLTDYQINDVGVEYRESFYTREAGPQLLRSVRELHPLADVLSPLTPALGLCIFSKARPNVHGTVALYLAEGGDSNNLPGLSCRHVLIGPKEANIDYVRHPGAPSKDVLLLGRRAFINFVDSIKVRIGRHGIVAKHRRNQIEWFAEREKGANTVDLEGEKLAQVKA